MARVAHASGALRTRDLARVTVDTTVQPKNISFPTNAKLLHAANRRRVERRQCGVLALRLESRIGAAGLECSAELLSIVVPRVIVRLRIGLLGDALKLRRVDASARALILPEGERAAAHRRRDAWRAGIGLEHRESSGVRLLGKVRVASQLVEGRE